MFIGQTYYLSMAHYNKAIIKRKYKFKLSFKFKLDAPEVDLREQGHIMWNGKKAHLI